jgi:hypothetical protein
MKLVTALTALCAIALAACGGGTPEASGDALAAMDADIAPAPAVAAMSTHTSVTRGSIPSAPGASQIVFSGHTFEVRDGGGGPGPNAWSNQNVWVDANGWLHLKISQQAGQWSCAEIWSDEALGFGAYQFKIAGHPEALDRNIVLGLFNYPTPDIGPDGTNEIDIEFATWGASQPQHGNWTVWPVQADRVPVARRPRQQQPGRLRELDLQAHGLPEPRAAARDAAAHEFLVVPGPGAERRAGSRDRHLGVPVHAGPALALITRSRFRASAAASRRT